MTGGGGGGGGGKFPEEENLLKATRLSEHRTFYELKNEASGMYCFVYSRHQKYSYIIGGSFPFDICVPGKERFNTGRDPFNQNSNRSDWEKWSTSKVDPFFRNFSGWTEPIRWVLDRTFRKFWLNGSRPPFVWKTRKFQGQFKWNGSSQWKCSGKK